nr:hypothetical protein Iba_chr10eCG5940 [Ipomoea batatas]
MSESREDKFLINEEMHLFISVHEIHKAIMVIVVMSTLGSVNRKLNHNGWTKCKLLILCKEVVNILIQNQATHRLQGQDVLRPGNMLAKLYQKLPFIFDVLFAETSQYICGAGLGEKTFQEVSPARAFEIEEDIMKYVDRKLLE